MLKIKFGGVSLAGAKAVNQDAFAARHPEGEELNLKGVVAALADGVSSCPDSHLASQTAVTSFVDDYFSTAKSWGVKTSVSRVLTSLNSWLAQQNSVRQDSDLLCTFSAVVIKSCTLYWFHVGDSRIYLYHKGKLECLTQDHVRREGGRTYLSKALGGGPRLEVDFDEVALTKGDRILLTSDGVHGVLSDREMLLLLQKPSESMESSAKRLVDAALVAGSHDNVSALILDIVGLPDASLTEQYERLTRLPIPPVLEVGHKLDGYEVEEVIFSGTRSHMYRVREKDTGKRMVLKAPSQNFSEDLVYLDGFVREEWVGMQLRNNHVMKTYAPQSRSWLYYLGEHIDGINLRQWMNEHPNPDLKQVREIVHQIILGLRAFERADMAHQDLKPENIMLDGNGRVVIIDFGATRISGVDELASPLDKSLPQGSVGYVAPEFLLGEPGSNRSDLFSLGVIVYEMLIGQRPYESQPYRSSIKRYSDMKYRSAASFGKRIPVWVEASLVKALQASPRERYSTYSEFERDLTIPNRELALAYEKKPLIERHPMRFWQVLSGILLLIVLIQQYLLQR